MATLNYATSYERALTQAYPNVLHFGELHATSNNAKYKFLDAKTIKIPFITTTGRKNVNRDAIDGAFSRSVDNDNQTLVMSFYREWSTLIDPVDMDETNQVVTITNATKVFNEEQKFPEKDAYLISKIYKDWTDAGKEADTTVLSTNNILSVFDKMMEDMDEKNVPAAGRILYCTPAVKTILKSAEGMVRNLSVQNNDGSINRLVNRLDEVKIVSVPSTLMKTAYTFTTGFDVADGAGQVNMFLVHPTAVLTPEKYEFAGTESPSAHTKGDYLYYEKSYEDVFIIEKHIDAIAFNVNFPSPVEPEIVSVEVSPATANVSAGGTQQFTAEVVVQGEIDDSVEWSLEGALDEGTTIVDGLLTVDADETAETITVVATAVEDDTKSDEAVVTIVEASE